MLSSRRSTDPPAARIARASVYRITDSTPTNCVQAAVLSMPVSADSSEAAGNLGVQRITILSFWLLPTLILAKAAPVAAFDRAAPGILVLFTRLRVPFSSAGQTPRRHPIQHFFISKPLRLLAGQRSGVTGSAPAVIRPAASRQRSSGVRRLCRSRFSLQPATFFVAYAERRAVPAARISRLTKYSVFGGRACQAGGFSRRTCANVRVQQSQPPA